MTDDYGKSSGNLIDGAPLVVEDLDLSGIGLYTEKDPSVPDDDYFPAEEVLGSMCAGYWARRSDEGKKWHVFEDKEIKLHKTLVNKEKK